MRRIPPAHCDVRWLYVDMNSFFASVEQQAKRSLRGRPVGIVATAVETTCCIAASYEAKSFGVKTGTSVRDARKLCPGIAIVEARPELYVRCHHAIIEAVESVLHVDRVCSIDEVAARLMGIERWPECALVIGEDIKYAIRKKVGPFIRCSVGAGPNAWLAKVATDLDKPDGLVVLNRSDLPDALHGLDLTDLPGIAKGMERRLLAAGIDTVQKLCQASEQQLAKIWGSKVMAQQWHAQLHGHDVYWHGDVRRTVGNGHVLPPKWRRNDKARRVAVRLVHKSAKRMRKLGYTASHLTLQLAMVGGGYYEQRGSLGRASDTLTILRALAPLWESAPRGDVLRVRVVLTGLLPARSSTIPLFDDQHKKDRLSQAIDKLDNKYGHHTVHFGSMFGAAKTAPTRISYTQIPEVGEF